MFDWVVLLGSSVIGSFLGYSVIGSSLESLVIGFRILRVLNDSILFRVLSPYFLGMPCAISYINNGFLL